MYRTILGVDITLEWNSDSDIEKRAKKYDIPSEYNLVMDTSGYYQGLKEIYSEVKKAQGVTDTASIEYENIMGVYKDDSQPVQFRLFETDGTEIFKIVNCYIMKPVKSDWNVENCFDSFPPYLDNDISNTHYFDLDLILDNSYLLNGKKYALEDLPSTDYYGVIIWNDFMKRSTKKLIKQVREKVMYEGRSITLF
jgi:hypothetical protein